VSVVNEIVLYFGSNAETMIASKTLKEAGVASRMIPRPAGIATASNLCISVTSDIEARATAVLTGAGVAPGGIAR
jgi:hypothetical protein